MYAHMSSLWKQMEHQESELYGRASGFMDMQLLGNYLIKMFKQIIRLIPTTFHCLCGIISPSWCKVDLYMRSCIPVETQVNITFF